MPSSDETGNESLPSIQISTRRSQACSILRDSIVQGRLAPGTKLISTPLAEQLGVSRTPLREALQVLEREGFVHRLPNGVLEVSGLAPRDLEELYAIRASLESIVAGSAAVHATAEQLAAMEVVLDRMRAAFRDEDSATLHEAGVRLHSLIQEASGLRFAGQLLDLVRGHLDRWRTHSTVMPGHAAEVLDEHVTIFTCLSGRRADAAAEAMREHVMHAWRAIRDGAGHANPSADGPALGKERKAILRGVG